MGMQELDAQQMRQARSSQSVQCIHCIFEVKLLLLLLLLQKNKQPHELSRENLLFCSVV